MALSKRGIYGLCKKKTTAPSLKQSYTLALWSEADALFLFFIEATEYLL